MSKRNIDVYRLNEQQFANAQKKISEKIIYETNQLLNKWKPKFKQFGYELKIQVDVSEQLENTNITPESDLSNFYSDPNLGAVAKELDLIANGMVEDLNNAVNSCNSLLNRYSMSCQIGFTSEAISE